MRRHMRSCYSTSAGKLERKFEKAMYRMWGHCCDMCDVGLDALGDSEGIYERRRNAGRSA